MWGVKSVSKKLQLSFGAGGGVKCMSAMNAKHARAIDGVRHLTVNCTMNAKRVLALQAMRHLMINCSM